MPAAIQRDLKPWQHQYYCGANSLYVFLSLRGHHVSHEQILRRFTPAGTGLTMQELSRAAADLGMRTEVIRAGVDALPTIDMPAIAHIEVEKGSGHFVVLCRAGPIGPISFIDGTSGRYHRMDRDTFLAKWSGYLLVAREPVGLQGARVTLFAVAGLNLVLLLLIPAVRWGRVMRRRLGNGTARQAKTVSSSATAPAKNDAYSQ